MDLMDKAGSMGTSIVFPNLKMLGNGENAPEISGFNITTASLLLLYRLPVFRSHGCGRHIHTEAYAATGTDDRIHSNGLS
jgi:hypothetical protein